MVATRGASSMADDLQVLGRKQDGLDAHKMHSDMDGTQPQPKPRGLNNIQNAERSEPSSKHWSNKFWLWKRRETKWPI